MAIPIWGVALAASALIGQGAAVVWSAATVSDKVQAINDRVTVIEGKLRENENDHATLARVDERTSDLVTTINRIDDRLSKQETRR